MVSKSNLLEVFPYSGTAIDDGLDRDLEAKIIVVYQPHFTRL